MTKPLKILLAEHDKEIASITKNYLVSRGFSVFMCFNGEEALQKFRNDQLDFVLVDSDIPIINSCDLASEIRHLNYEIPIIFLSSSPHQNDIINAFNVGADDFIARPFSMEELGLRIDAIHKRTKAREKRQNIFKFGNYTLDTLHHVLIHNGKEHKLTTKELDLLYLFCEYKNRVVERSVALKRVWKAENYFSARNMDVYIGRLRNMLGADPMVHIENIRGIGYKLVVKLA